MAEEKEIKLKLPVHMACKVYTLDVLLHANALGESLLKNTYYDTSRLFLSANKTALRIREEKGKYIQTLKTQGTSDNGLHIRNEWEWELDSSELDKSKLGDSGLPALGLNTMDELLPIFTTDFTRELWLLKLNEDRDVIEIALDRGSVFAVSKSKQKREAPICELELELKQGSEGALRTLAEEITQQLPELIPYDVSKAQRGYQLFLDQPSE